MNGRRLSRRAALAGGAVALAQPVWAQGFAGLGSAADGYAVPERGRALTFPADHGAHPGYRIEWWYLTANLRDLAGRDLGLQWTLFRSALRPPEAGRAEAGTAGEGWQVPQIWLAHAAVTTPDIHLAAERYARGGVGQAGVIPLPFAAWLDEWALAATDNQGGDALDRLTLRASSPDFSYDIRLVAEGPLVPQGDRGYSVKSPAGQASYYYSQPFYRAEGVLRLPEGEVAVTGQAWLDREWSSQPLADTQDGWDWVSLHLDTGDKMMGFRLRDRAGAPFTSATHIAPDGTPTPYSDGALTLTPLQTTRVAGRDVPTVWQARLPDQGIDVRLTAVNPLAWMDLSFGYWEGPVRIDGSHTGRGYLEMTGYEEA